MDKDTSVRLHLINLRHEWLGSGRHNIKKGFYVTEYQDFHRLV